MAEEREYFIKVGSDFKKVTKEVKETGKEVQKATGDVSTFSDGLDQATGGAITKFRGLITSIKGAAKGFRGLKVAIASTGIGALIIAIGAVATAFTNSEKGQNQFTKIMNQIGVVVGNVRDIIAELGQGILTLGKAFGDLFSGGKFSDFRKTAGSAFDEVGRKVKVLGDETRREIKLVRELSDATAKLTKDERDLLVFRAKQQAKIDELKLKSVQVDKFSTEERIKFLQQAQAAEDKLFDREEKIAAERFRIKQEENSLSESTREDLMEEAQLEADLITLRAVRLVRAKEVQGQISALNLQNITEKKAANKEERDNESATITESLGENIGALVKLQEAEITTAATTNQLTQAFARETTEVKTQLSQSEKDQIIADAQATLGEIAAIAGQGSAVGKAAAVAQATISGVQAVQNTFNTASASPITALFPPYPYIRAGLAAAFTAKRIKDILAVPKPSVGGGGGGSSASISVGRGGGEGATTQPPDFNVVGTTGTNQLAESIAQQQGTPVKAFVVSDEVSTAQSLDRNIIESASI
jgi:hypothetical protein